MYFISLPLCYAAMFFLTESSHETMERDLVLCPIKGIRQGRRLIHPETRRLDFYSNLLGVFVDRNNKEVIESPGLGHVYLLRVGYTLPGRCPMRYLFAVLALCVLIVPPACGCMLPLTPPVVEVPSGLGNPVSEHRVGDYRCYSWQFDGCLHTFCADPWTCEWSYKGGTRVDGTTPEELQKPCPVPQGYVHLVVIPPDWVKDLDPRLP